MPTKAEKEHALTQNFESELWKQLREIGLAAVIERAVGSGAGVITFLWSLVKSHVHKMREMAQEDLRAKYSDQRILVLGQQVAGAFSSEDCWAFVHQIGGTIWVQNVYVTASEGLSLLVLWHPDPEFQVEKNFIRIYRGSNQCTIDDTGPTIRAAR